MGPAGLPRQPGLRRHAAGKTDGYLLDAGRGVHGASGVRQGLLQQNHQTTRKEPAIRHHQDGALVVHGQPLRRPRALLQRQLPRQEQGPPLNRRPGVHQDLQQPIRRLTVQGAPASGGGRRGLLVVQRQGGTRTGKKAWHQASGDSVVGVPRSAQRPHEQDRHHRAALHQVHQAEPPECARRLPQAQRHGAAQVRRRVAGGAGEPCGLPGALPTPRLLRRLQSPRQTCDAALADGRHGRPHSCAQAAGAPGGRPPNPQSPALGLQLGSRQDAMLPQAGGV
mmetsp:Transcript_26664/g.66325  ORF Transcript_26664/g.66325 Transcript_26664/m.66325 type:complete len:280 (-) Transcript_26664:226-1065(-)